MATTIPIKKFGKQDREKKVLLGLVEYYIKTGRPVGSNTLKEAGFEDLSAATIRNYFAHLEDEGYLSQHHVSGGRLPTNLAYRFYAQKYQDEDENQEDIPEEFDSIKKRDSKEIASLLQESAELLSRLTNCAIFFSSPRFDHDFVVDIRLISLDIERCLCIIMTDFGMIRTEILPVETKLSSFAVKRIESYFRWRLTGLNPPENIKPEEENFAKNLYNELMVRYIVGYSNFIEEDIYRTGFSRLLTFPDFHEGDVLARSLALFENAHQMRLLLRESVVRNQLKFWIGDDLAPYAASHPDCAVIAIPYFIHQTPVAAIGLLGPTRMPYRQLFKLLRIFTRCLSEALTRNLYKFKIQFRQPERGSTFLGKEEKQLIEKSHLKLLENKRI